MHLDASFQHEPVIVHRKSRLSVLSAQKFWLPLGMVLGLTLIPVVGDAKGSDPVRYSVRSSASSIEAGAARVRVDAPASSVMGMVTNYGQWDRVITRFDKVRVVGRTANTVDVYMQVPILKGAAKIWAVVRFEAPKSVGAERVVEGHMVKGNVERLDAKWRVAALDDRTSELHLEMLIVPKLPVPGSLVTGEVAYAADKAVLDLRTEIESQH